jgi:hyaluronate lyase
MKTARRWSATVVAQACLLLGLQGGTAHADEYDNLRQRWLARITNGTTADADVAAQIASANATAQTYWSTLQTAPDRTALWPTLPLGTASGNITGSMQRLAALATAYASPASPYYHDAAVLAAVTAAADWLVAQHYSASTASGYDNWWDWQIGTPQALNNLAACLYDALTPAQLAAYLAAIDRFDPDPAWRTNMNGTLSTQAETGANRLDKAFVAVLRGVLGKSDARIAAGRDAISQVYLDVASGDGFYSDGSFIQHSQVPYVGSYGNVLLTDIARLYYLLNGSSWSVTDANVGKPYDWVMRSYRPFVYDGAMMDMERGRAVARQYTTDHIAGRQTVAAIAELAAVLPAVQAVQLQALAKGWMQRDASFGSSYYVPVPTSTAGVTAGLSTYSIGLLKAIENDPAIEAVSEAVATRYLPATDRAVQRRPGHAFGLSMFSKRISAFEYGGGENARGWWSGMGMTYLYNGDQGQYNGNYWATADMGRLPGTTTDRSGSGTPRTYYFYPNSMGVGGGAELNGQFATAAMDFATLPVTGTSLYGKKAWFLFGDRVVAAGAGITSTDSVAVETIVENRKLNAGGDNALTVNGVAQSSGIGWSETMAGVSWAHLAGSQAGADIGYVFPDLPAVTGLRETRSGAWSSINLSGTTDVHSDNYLSLALNHGSNPAGAGYTYIVLPNYTAAQVAAFAAANPVSVLERSTYATAVRDSEQGLTGVVFWIDTPRTVSAGGAPYLSSDKKAVLTIQERGGQLQLAVADPTQANTGSINLELMRSAGAVISADPAITVTQLSPTIKLSVAASGSAGASRTATFALARSATLSPVADAFVRDGTYAGVNNGSTTMLTVKQAATSYTRKSYLKFDLSAIPGTIASATLKLTATSVGSSSAMTHNLYQTASDSWSESGLTWTNSPANASLLGSWTVPALNSAVQLDITAAASSVMGGSKLLSLEVESAADYGSGGQVDYGARENPNASYRPVLVVSYY